MAVTVGTVLRSAVEFEGTRATDASVSCHLCTLYVCVYMRMLTLIGSACVIPAMVLCLCLRLPFSIPKRFTRLLSGN
jgi:hypothetical protein